MPNRAMELRHLVQADRLISEVDRRVLTMEAIARAVALKMNADQARVSLTLIVESVAICRAHRLLILRTIDDIDRRHPIPQISN